jgi:hypothetical protein
MSSTPDQDSSTSAARSGGKDTAKQVRENRRKAALKANMARRKAQARAKAGEPAQDGSGNKAG